MARPPRKTTRAAAPRGKKTASAAKSAKTPAASATPARMTSPIRPTTPADTFTSKPVDISFATPEHRFARADLEIEGIYHGEASYEGRVFLNNPKADASTPKTLDNGYAGSFNIFGHGGCVGDPGHCELNGSKISPYDRRNPHPLTPARKKISVTNALKSIARTSATATVTVVPVVNAANALCDTKNVFRCSSLRFVSYN